MLLAFDDDGPGPVVVLLHGFPLDRSMWSHQQSSVGAIYRVIAPDLRGHGTTAAPDDLVYSVDALADDVIETLDALQLTGPVTVGGLSLGGYVALSIAERYPERLNALMLLNTRETGDTPEAAASRREMADAVDRTGDVEPVIARMLPRLLGADFARQHPDTVSRFHSRMSRMAPRAVAATLRGMAERPDRTGILGTIAVPTLVVSGAADEVVPADETRAMVAAIPKARHIEIPRAGHLAPVEDAASVDAEILEFLQTLW